MVISARSSVDDLITHSLADFNITNVTSVKHDVLAKYTMYLVSENIRLETENGKLSKRSLRFSCSSYAKLYSDEVRGSN